MQSRPVPDRQAVRSSPPADERRKPARDLIVAVLENMRRNLEPLRYSTLAPSRYVVYLHPIEYARLEGIVPLLQEQTIRALDEEIARINRRSPVRRSVARLFGEWHAPVQTAAGAWHVEFLPDPDGELAEGDILIDSELLLPSPPEPGAGQRTRRITTVHTAARTTTRARTADVPPPLPQVQAFARLTYDDDSGHHVFDVVRDSVTIGRGGVTYPVDVRIVSSVDVSREHARIRRDPQSNAFFLIDLSSLGTSLNGRHVPRGYDEVDGTKRENGAETPLPDQARISLADTVSLHFAVMR
jgi:pSer/pThr/pTyr-binding forkhead associated (FHA) protein